MARLIVNADDLGLTPCVNDGIFRAHRRGILTSASLFANALSTDDAIARAAACPSLGIGCHLALVDARPVLPPAQVPTLVADGELRPSWRPFIRATLAGRIALPEVERELTAQIDRIRSAGVTLTHLDGHKHVHAYPPIFEIVVRLARRFAIPAVRVPFEAPHWRRLASTAAVANLAMWPWAATDRRRAEREGVRAPAFTGRLLTGTLTVDALVTLIDRLPEGTTELMVHPGDVDDLLRQQRTRLVDSRAEEVAALCAPETMAAIARRGITLVRHDLRPVSDWEPSRAS